MLPRAPALAALILCVTFAGCTGSSVPASTPTPTSAAAPVAAAETGSISGVVTDEEKMPIPEADVAVLELNRKTQTDAAGAFTFNEVTPGSFGVVVTRLGFDQGAKKVDVLAGEVTEVKFVLAAYVIKEEPYQATLPFTALVTFGQALVDNRIPGGTPMCQGCDRYPRFTPGPQQVRAEITFTNGIPVPNDDAWVDLRRAWTNATGTHSQSDGSSVGYGYIKDRGKLEVAEAGIKAMKADERIWYHSVSGTAPSLNKRINSYLSFSYHGDFPETFTALPPP